MHPRFSSITSPSPSDGRPRAVRVLDVDEELAASLPETERGLARDHAIGDLYRVEKGLWAPPAGRLLAIMVLDGPILLERSVGGASAVELLGDGDIVLWGDAAEDGAGFLKVDTAWLALGESRVICLDERFARATRACPQLGIAVLRRTEARAQRLTTMNAITRFVRVETRLLLALWLLSERWGHVTPDGVLLRVSLTHQMLAELVGAARPTVTTALSQLQRNGQVARRDDGWLLLGDPPTGDSALIAGPWSRPSSDGASPLAG